MIKRIHDNMNSCGALLKQCLGDQSRAVDTDSQTPECTETPGTITGGYLPSRAQLLGNPYAPCDSAPFQRDHSKINVTHSPWTYIRQAPMMPFMAMKTDILTRFGRRVRALRTARGQSQETFADACGIDRTYISGIERGRRNVGLKNIEVIANALGVTLSELFEEV